MSKTFTASSINAFFASQGIELPIGKTSGRSVVPPLFTVWKNPDTGKTGLTPLAKVASYYADVTRRYPPGYKPVSDEQRRRSNESFGDTSASRPFLQDSVPTKMEFIMSELMQSGNLFFYPEGGKTPVGIQAKPMTEAEREDPFHVAGSFSVDTNAYERLIAKPQPYMSLGRRFLSVFGAYKAERAVYDKAMAEYKFGKKLKEGVASLAPEREKALEVEKEQTTVRERGKTRAQDTMTSFELLKPDEELSGGMKAHVPVFDDAQGWPKREDRKAEYARRANPSYKTKLQALRGVQEDNKEWFGSLRAQHTTLKVKDGLPALCDGESYLELVGEKAQPPVTMAREYTRFLHALSNLHFNDKPEKRQEDLTYLTNFCTEVATGLKKSMSAAGFSGRELDDHCRNNYLASATLAHASTDKDVMGKFVSDTRTRSAFAGALLRSVISASNSNGVEPQLVELGQTIDRCFRCARTTAERLANTTVANQEPLKVDAHRLDSENPSLEKSLQEKVLHCRTPEAMKCMVAQQLVKQLQLPASSVDKTAYDLAHDSKSGALVESTATKLLSMKAVIDPKNLREPGMTAQLKEVFLAAGKDLQKLNSSPEVQNASKDADNPEKDMENKKGLQQGKDKEKDRAEMGGS